MAWPTVGIITAAVALAAALAWWLWWGLPKRQVNRFRISDPKTRADIEDNLRKTSGQLLGGAAVLIGAGFAYLQFTQQQQASQQQLRVSVHQIEQQQRAAHDLLISNQVAKGFELLGNKDNQIQRLGGIYALEGVMNTSEEYHQPVLEALSAFVRDGTHTVTGNDPPATDIQAALTVIGRRKTIREAKPNLAKAFIPKGDLSGARLSGARLSRADLSGANLEDANLSDADLRDADLSMAYLADANLSWPDEPNCPGGPHLPGSAVCRRAPELIRRGIVRYRRLILGHRPAHLSAAAPPERGHHSRHDLPGPYYWPRARHSQCRST